MILFYSPGTCSLAGLVLLQWLGIPHRLCRVARDERRGPEYRRAVNEQGQVPVLLHDGEVLTENAAILLWLADRRPEAGLVPAAGSADRYRVYRWLSWLDSGFHMAHAPLFKPERYDPDPNRHDALRRAALDAIREQLAILDAHLDGRRHVLLDRPNLLDGYVFAMARWCEERIGYERDFPQVHRFLSAMRDDPGIQTGLGIEAGTVEARGPLLGHVAWAGALGADGRLRPDLDP
jgi:glutathione S-transferase